MASILCLGVLQGKSILRHTDALSATPASINISKNLVEKLRNYVKLFSLTNEAVRFRF